MASVGAEVWGTGTRAVLVHGSLATGPLEWEQQRPLTDSEYQLVVPTRRGYTPQTTGVGEDFAVDGTDVVELLGDGAHLVGHSYGGLAAMVAAAQRPEAVRSLLLAEPPAFQVAATDPDVTALREATERVLSADVDDREFLERFLAAVGTPVSELPPEVLDTLTTMAPAVRRGRRPWDGELPVAALSEAPFLTVVVSGGHHPAFTAICQTLARRLGAEHRVVEGAGHEVQLAAEEFNAVLLELWGRAR